MGIPLWVQDSREGRGSTSPSVPSELLPLTCDLHRPTPRRYLGMGWAGGLCGLVGGRGGSGAQPWPSSQAPSWQGAESGVCRALRGLGSAATPRGAGQGGSRLMAPSSGPGQREGCRASTWGWGEVLPTLVSHSLLAMGQALRWGQSLTPPVTPPAPKGLWPQGAGVVPGGCLPPSPTQSPPEKRVSWSPAVTLLKPKRP